MRQVTSQNPPRRPEARKGCASLRGYDKKGRAYRGPPVATPSTFAASSATSEPPTFVSLTFQSTK